MSVQCLVNRHTIVKTETKAVGFLIMRSCFDGIVTRTSEE